MLARKSAPRTHDEYLAALTPDKRATLAKLRKAISAAAPGAEECISYGIPAYRHRGRIIAFYHAATHHCSFFPGAHPIAVNADALAGYETSKGTVRFAIGKPLPSALVKTLVKTRIAEFALKTERPAAKPGRPATNPKRPTAKTRGAVSRAVMLLLSVVVAATTLRAQSSAPSGSGGHNEPRHAAAPTIVLLSLDGFRYDYLDRYPGPNFARLLAHGVRAEGLIPAFPSKTFPNHFTIVTGLEPQHHGLVANRFFDPARNASYGMSDTLAVRDGTWYHGEPVWVTAERQGMVAASYFWPGSEADIGGLRPTRVKAYDGKVPNADRVDTVLAWLALPVDTRPHFVTLYFSTTDDGGHKGGPESAEAAEAVRTVDGSIGRLLDGLERANVGAAGIELIVVADHGMAAFTPAQYVALDTVIDLQEVRVADGGPNANLHVGGGKGRAITLRDSINRRMQHGRAWLREDVPEALHYRDDPRIGDLVIVMALPWQVGLGRSAPRSAGGTHGWNPANREMQGIFVSWRPDAAGPARVGTVMNVDIARDITDRLGLAPAPTTDGVPGRLAQQLRDARR